MEEINFNNNKEMENAYSDKDFQGKYISIKEFKEKGYLQEVNRLFLHKLGLALELGTNGEDYKILGIIDCRDEGIHFGLEDSEINRLERFKNNKEYISQEMIKQSKIRGFDTEDV